jgi:hypothetical protein
LTVSDYEKYYAIAFSHDHKEVSVSQKLKLLNSLEIKVRDRINELKESPGATGFYGDYCGYIDPKKSNNGDNCCVNPNKKICGILEYRCEKKYLLYKTQKQLEDAGAKLVDFSKCVSPKNIDSCQKISQTLWEGKFNYSSEDIKILQNYLDSIYEPEYRAGIFSKQDGVGVYGWRTKKLIEVFQKENKIRTTGIVGPQTLEKINSMLCKI